MVHGHQQLPDTITKYARNNSHSRPNLIHLQFTTIQLKGVIPFECHNNLID